MWPKKAEKQQEKQGKTLNSKQGNKEVSKKTIPISITKKGNERVMQMTGMYDRLLETARKDLEASRILHKKKLYPQAVFYFQQSVEKSVKSFGLIEKMIDEKNLTNKIGHKPLKIFTRLIKKHDKRPKMKKIVKELEALQKDDKAYADISQKELKSLITSLENILRDIETFKPESELSEEQLKTIRTGFIKGLDGIKTKHPEEYEQFFGPKLEIESMMRALFKSFLMRNHVNMSSAFLAYIAGPHSVLSRYPKKNFSPEEFYNRENPLVKSLPKLIKIQDKKTKIMENLAKLENMKENDPHYKRLLELSSKSTKKN